MNDFKPSLSIGLLLCSVLWSPASAAVLVKDDALKIELGGFVAVQSMFDTNSAVSQSHLNNVAAKDSGGRFHFAFDATRLNLVATSSGDEWTGTGRLEFDLQSSIFFRVRHAYAALQKGSVQVLVGQTDTLVGNWVGPHLFNNDWFWSQGNAYDRMPQLRVAYNGERTYAALAAVPSVVGAPGAVPHFQARVGYRFGDGGAVGLATHFGSTSNVAAEAAGTGYSPPVGPVTSWLAEADLALPLGPALVSLEGWYGEAGGHGTGGHTLGGPLFVVNSSGAAVPVPAGGGFLDVLFNVTPKVSAGVAAGVNLVTRDTVADQPIPVTRNATAGAYASYQLTRSWSGAVDVQWASTRRALDPGSPGTRSDVSNLRFLVGSKLSF